MKNGLKQLLLWGLLLQLLLPQITLAEENRTINDMLNEEEEASTLEENQEKEAPAVSNETDPGLVEDKSLFSIFFQLFVALAVVIGIMYFLLKVINKRTQRFQSHQTMQNLGGIPLGQNKSVQLVKVGERVLVVGVGDSIQLLKEIDNEEEMDTLLAAEKPNALSSVNRLFPSSVSSSTSSPKPSSFQKMFADQLGEMKETRKKARHRLKEHDQ